MTTLTESLVTMALENVGSEEQSTISKAAMSEEVEQ